MQVVIFNFRQTVQYGRYCSMKTLIVNLMKSKCRLSISNVNLAFKLRCALNIKYTLDFKDFLWIKGYKASQ